MSEGRKALSFGGPLAALVFLFVLLPAGRTLSDTDLGWHIRTGERIVRERAVPTTDDFSHTADGSRWRVNQPLAEVLLYGVDEALGPIGLIALRALLAVAMFGFVLAAGRLGRERNPLLEAGILLAAMLASSSHLLLRPNTMSALLLAVTAWTTDRMRRGETVRPWVLPALFAVWVHVHPGFLFGLGFLACFAAADLLEKKIPSMRTRAPGGGGRADLLRVLLLSIAAGIASGAILNPSGFRAILLPLGLQETGAFHFRALQEFQPAHPARDPFFFVLLGAALVSLFPRRGRNAGEILAMLLFGLLALRAVRMIQPFAVLAAPIAMRNLAPGANRLLPAGSGRARALLVLASAGVIGLGVWWWQNDPLRIPPPAEARRIGNGWAWAPRNYPIRAFRFLEAEKLPGEVFHPDRFGGPFVWYFYPSRKDFIDGRIEVFGEKFWVDVYGRILGLGPGWEDLLDRYRVNTLLLDIGSGEEAGPLARSMTERDEWMLVYFDDEAAIFVRRAAVDPDRARALALPAIDPFAGPSPRSYEEEVLGAAGVRRCLEAGPSRRALLFRMRLLARRGNWAAVAETPDASIGAGPGALLAPALFLERGEARFRVGDWKGAPEDWKRAESIGAARANLSLLNYLERGSLDRLDLAPADRAGGLARLAGLLREAGEYERAAALLREAVRAGALPGHRNDLAWTLLEGDIGEEEALREAREAAGAMPGDGYARGTLSLALERSGEAGAAAEEAREAIRLLPPEDYRVGASLRARLALLLARTGGPAAAGEARRLAAEALRLDFETERRLDLLCLLGREGAGEIARLALREGDLRNRAGEVEGEEAVPDRGRQIYMELLRDIGRPWEEIERLADKLTPKTKDAERRAGRSAGKGSVEP
ncbi:MAG: hypothetical protein EHM19_05755 [Candidatus Latescibacterota bacterium]|nr:MAG: hypothetical protein EHM19_05755 [Candidatus Latescibacterota bacterium]